MTLRLPLSLWSPGLLKCGCGRGYVDPFSVFKACGRCHAEMVQGKKKPTNAEKESQP